MNWWLYIVGGVVTLGAAVVAAVAGRGLSQASAAKTVAEGAKLLIAPYIEENKRLASRLADLEREYAELRDQMSDRRNLTSRIEYLDSKLRDVTARLELEESTTQRQAERISELEAVITRNGLETP